MAKPWRMHLSAKEKIALRDPSYLLHMDLVVFGRWDAGYKRVQTLVSSLIGTSQEKGEAALSETSNYTSVASSTDASCPRAPLPTN
ncbi:hypothetical protein PENANT_c053G03186 [Penicillium antarcticum]|uniref:Uncharacterized protein n=1 Tax=Penicillium antarcticum TaxID=416450 RepID=A0A1V6PQN2_9EURO|nr:hypothetical protein PENANT_c053G03186 [Penicillium antarcticum]